MDAPMKRMSIVQLPLSVGLVQISISTGQLIKPESSANVPQVFTDIIVTSITGQ
jgi:hypothetical protein